MKTKEELLKEFEELKIDNTKNNSCNFCNFCNSCYSCKFCNYCDFCLRLTNGLLCKGLRFEYDDKNAYNKNKYWILNKEVSKKEFEEIKKGKVGYIKPLMIVIFRNLKENKLFKGEEKK